MVWCASRSNLIALGGLPSEAYQPDARQLDAIWPAQNLFELRGHGYGAGASVRFAARVGGTLPAALNLPPPGWYPVEPTTDPDFFTLAGVTLADAGSGAIVLLENYWPKIDAKLLRWTSWVVAHAKAYSGPWTTPPAWAPGVVAALVAFDAAVALRLPEARYDIADLRKKSDQAMEFCDKKLDAGAPYSDGGGPIDATPTVADNGAKLVPRRCDSFGVGDGEFRA